MWWKVRYSVRRPNALLFGQVLFLETDGSTLSLEFAREAAQETQQTEDGGGLVEHLEILPSSAAAAAAHDTHRAKVARWMGNVKVGVPNRRGDL